MKMRDSPDPRHLLHRLAESISAKSVSVADLDWVRERLTEPEFTLWDEMQIMDKVHSIGVARRLIEVGSDTVRVEIAAALLHDVGKSGPRLGVIGRVCATVLGSRTKRWREYRDHERVGAQMCRSAGLDPRICDLIDGSGDPDALIRLRRADDL